MRRGFKNSNRTSSPEAARAEAARKGWETRRRNAAKTKTKAGRK